jgi:hypothetical protein
MVDVHGCNCTARLTAGELGVPRPVPDRLYPQIRVRHEWRFGHP